MGWSERGQLRNYQVGGELGRTNEHTDIAERPSTIAVMVAIKTKLLGIRIRRKINKTILNPLL